MRDWYYHVSTTSFNSSSDRLQFSPRSFHLLHVSLMTLSFHLGRKREVAVPISVVCSINVDGFVITTYTK